MLSNTSETLDVGSKGLQPLRWRKQGGPQYYWGEGKGREQGEEEEKEERKKEKRDHNFELYTFCKKILRIFLVSHGTRKTYQHQTYTMGNVKGSSSIKREIIPVQKYEFIQRTKACNLATTE